MAKAIRDGAWPGITVDPTVVENVYLRQDCVPCLLAKFNRPPRSLGSSILPNPFTVASVDYKPIKPTAIGGYSGFYLFVERTSGYKIVILLKTSPSAQDLITSVSKVSSVFRAYGHRLTILRCDAGKVETSTVTNNTLRDDHGISVEPAAPESQFQNECERHMQTVLKGVASMFATALCLSNAFWAMALLSFVNACNCVPNLLSTPYSPEYALTGRHPNLPRRFRFAFGLPVVAHLLNQDRIKRKHLMTFTPQAEYGYAVGSVAHSGATLVYFPQVNTQRVQVRQDVQAIRMLHTVPRSQADTEAFLPQDSDDGTTTFPSTPGIRLFDMRPSGEYDDIAAAPVGQSYTFHDLSSSEESLWPSPRTDESPRASHSEGIYHYVSPSEDSDTSSEDVPPVSADRKRPCSYDPPDAVPPPSTTSEPATAPRSKRSCHLPRHLTDTYEVRTAFTDPHLEDLDPWSLDDYVDIKEAVATAPSTAKVDPTQTPKLRAAMKSSDWEPMWKPAIDAEMQNLKEHDTYEEIEFADIPPDATIYPTKMDLKQKHSTLGVFTKAKARLVVIGNFVTNVFKSLFAPTVNERSVKLLFLLSIIFGLFVTGVDVKGAFLYPNQTSDVFICLPPALNNGDPKYWKLKKTLYGLSESPRAFYDDCSHLLLSRGYTRTTADPCMFYKLEGIQYILVVVHVDDFVLASTNKALQAELLSILRSRYTITTQSSVEDFIGLHIEHNIDESMLLSQPHQIEMIARDYKLTNVPCPQVPMSSLFNDAYQDAAPLVSTESYMRLLGRLLFIIKTRPDTAYALNRLATRSHHATERDFKALLRVASYLYGTRHLGLRIKKSSSTDRATAARLACYVDASYATHADNTSHTGYCFSLGDTLAMFYSRTFKQSNVTLSSTEAENAAAVEATKEVIWFRQLLNEIGFPQTEPTQMFADNASMITLATDFSGNHKRVKHYMTRINFMIEQVKMQTIHLEHVPTEKNVADILTKPLAPKAFLALRPILLGAI